MVFAKSWNLIKSADLQEFAKLKKYIPPQPLWSEYTVKLWSNCKVKLKNKQVYPHQSRCDVTTSQQIGTLSRSACDFSPESLWTLCQFINRIPIGAKKITLFKQHHPTFIKKYWKTVTHGANRAFWTFWNFAGGQRGQLFPRIFNFCKVSSRKTSPGA